MLCAAWRIPSIYTSSYVSPGPRVYLTGVLTEAELEPDEIMTAREMLAVGSLFLRLPELAR